MSLKPTDPLFVPEETVRVAKAAFPKGSLALRLREVLAGVYDDSLFSHLFSHCGPPAESPWRLALVTVLQFAENLTDRQAADAVRGRIDWKCSLGLELTDAGFDFSVLSKFRSRLLAEGAETLLLEALLDRCKEQGLLRQRGQARTDSTHVLASVKMLNRLENATETLRAALNAVATEAPEWLAAWVPEEWFRRYSHRAEALRLPKGSEARQSHAERVGIDGIIFMEQVYGVGAPAHLGALPEIETLRMTWLHHYWLDNGKVRLREAKDLPPAGVRTDSPYDTEAHYGIKKGQAWLGYKLHLTESCDDDLPHLITHVETTDAGVQDVTMLVDIHPMLSAKGCLPREHLADSGYVDAELIVDSRDTYDLHLIGPVRPDISWQARTPGAYSIDKFEIDWDKQQATCPEGKHNSTWTQRRDAWDNEIVRIKFAHRDCKLCPTRSLCTRTAQNARGITLRPQKQHEALVRVRQLQDDPEWQRRYQKRAGIEGSMSQGVRALGMRQTRYLGLAKTKFQHLATAAGINLSRIAAWYDDKPRAKTRVSRFARLAA